MTDERHQWAEEIHGLIGDLRELEDRLRVDEEGEEEEGGPSPLPHEEIKDLLEGCARRIKTMQDALAESSEVEARVSEARARILVVDDDETSRTLLTTFMDRYGDVSWAESGPHALALVTKAVRSGHYFRLILLDFHMPEMDGHTTLQRIRALEEVYSAREPSVIAMTTAVGDRETVIRARQAGTEAYFVKPLDLDKLGKWVEDQGLERA